MSNNDGGGAGSSSNPNRPPVVGSPRRRRDGPNSPSGRRRAPLFTPPRTPGGSIIRPGLGFGGGEAVPVGGSGSGGAAGGGGGGGGSPSGRKRGREGGADGGAGEGNHKCSVCDKRFHSLQAMFGHLRSHPDRGWSGAYPPPAFRAEDEFADIREAAAGEEEEAVNYKVPDLNNPPPPDSN